MVLGVVAWFVVWVGWLELGLLGMLAGYLWLWIVVDVLMAWLGFVWLGCGLGCVRMLGCGCWVFWRVICWGADVDDLA